MFNNLLFGCKSIESKNYFQFKFKNKVFCINNVLKLSLIYFEVINKMQALIRLIRLF
jgi:hypothetical protein